MVDASTVRRLSRWEVVLRGLETALGQISVAEVLQSLKVLEKSFETDFYFSIIVVLRSEKGRMHRGRVFLKQRALYILCTTTSRRMEVCC